MTQVQKAIHEARKAVYAAQSAMICAAVLRVRRERKERER